MRIKSSEVFRVNGNGTVTVIKPIKIGGVSFSNVVFSGGVKVGEINLIDFVGKDLEVEKENDVFVITRIYE